MASGRTRTSALLSVALLPILCAGCQGLAPISENMVPPGPQQAAQAASSPRLAVVYHGGARSCTGSRISSPTQRVLFGEDIPEESAVQMLADSELVSEPLEQADQDVGQLKMPPRKREPQKSAASCTGLHEEADEIEQQGPPRSRTRQALSSWE